MKKRLLFLLVPVALAAVAAGCGDDPFTVRWVENPDTVRLFALSRPEPNLVSGYDFFPRRAVRIEALTTGSSWDAAVDIREGKFAWLPAGALGIVSQSALATLDGDQTFESATSAPADTAAYVSDAPVPITVGQIYVIRTRRHPGLWGTQCTYYGKIEPLEANVADGVVVFKFDVSGACNSRSLVPPD